MPQLNLLVTLSPEEALRRLRAAAAADRIQVQGTVASFRLEVLPKDDEPTVHVTGALLPDAAGTRLILSEAAPPITLHLFGLLASVFAAFIAFKAVRYEGAGVIEALITSAAAAAFFGGIAWLIGVMTAAPATDRVRRLARGALSDAIVAGPAAEPAAEADNAREFGA